LLVEHRLTDLIRLRDVTASAAIVLFHNQLFRPDARRSRVQHWGSDIKQEPLPDLIRSRAPVSVPRNERHEDVTPAIVARDDGDVILRMNRCDGAS
jgi:hypothetical protein